MIFIFRIFKNKVQLTKLINRQLIKALRLYSVVFQGSDVWGHWNGMSSFRDFNYLDLF